MITREIKDTAIIETPQGVDGRNLYDKAEAQINVITLKQHITPVNVDFFACTMKEEAV